ncbi:hypothetical protein DFJ73DRAFT_774396 [Zopfochytrium polystomum]|nr:hypothetical protein DFJ73DRAFT_774396 [Zopfochytrium polystomum]
MKASGTACRECSEKKRKCNPRKDGPEPPCEPCASRGLNCVPRTKSRSSSSAASGGGGGGGAPRSRGRPSTAKVLAAAAEATAAAKRKLDAAAESSPTPAMSPKAAPKPFERPVHHTTTTTSTTTANAGSTTKNGVGAHAEQTPPLPLKPSRGVSGDNPSGVKLKIKRPKLAHSSSPTAEGAALLRPSACTTTIASALSPESRSSLNPTESSPPPLPPPTALASRIPANFHGCIQCWKETTPDTAAAPPLPAAKPWLRCGACASSFHTSCVQQLLGAVAAAAAAVAPVTSGTDPLLPADDRDWTCPHCSRAVGRRRNWPVARVLTFRDLRSDAAALLSVGPAISSNAPHPAAHAGSAAARYCRPPSDSNGVACVVSLPSPATRQYLVKYVGRPYCQAEWVQAAWVEVRWPDVVARFWEAEVVWSGVQGTRDSWTAHSYPVSSVIARSWLEIDAVLDVQWEERPPSSSLTTTELCAPPPPDDPASPPLTEADTTMTLHPLRVLARWRGLPTSEDCWVDWPKESCKTQCKACAALETYKRRSGAMELESEAERAEADDVQLNDVFQKTNLRTVLYTGPPRHRSFLREYHLFGTSDDDDDYDRPFLRCDVVLAVPSAVVDDARVFTARLGPLESVVLALSARRHVERHKEPAAGLGEVVRALKTAGLMESARCRDSSLQDLDPAVLIPLACFVDKSLAQDEFAFTRYYLGNDVGVSSTSSSADGRSVFTRLLRKSEV